MTKEVLIVLVSNLSLRIDSIEPPIFIGTYLKVQHYLDGAINILTHIIPEKRDLIFLNFFFIN